jgi:alpha-L-rhamnosidase
VLIEPHPGPLSEARARHESPYGEIEVRWTVRDRRLALEVTMPVNTTATVILPNGGIEEIGSGRYRFRSAL